MPWHGTPGTSLHPRPSTGLHRPIPQKGRGQKCTCRGPEESGKWKSSNEAQRWDGSGVMVPGRLSSHQPGNSQSSHHAQAFTRERHKVKTLYNQVGEGRHSSDATTAWWSEQRNNAFHSAHFKRRFLRWRRNLWAGRRSQRSTSVRPSSDPPPFPFSGTWGRTGPPGSRWLQRRCWRSSRPARLGAGLEGHAGREKAVQLWRNGSDFCTQVFLQGRFIYLIYHWTHLSHINTQKGGRKDKSVCNPLKRRSFTCWFELKFEDTKKPEKCSALKNVSSSSNVRFNKLSERVVKHIGLNASFQR